MLYTTKEAVALLQRVRGKAIHIGAEVPVPIVDEEGTYTKKIFPGYILVRVSRKQAIRHIQDLLGGYEKRSGRINITVEGPCVFIGGVPRNDSL